MHINIRYFQCIGIIDYFKLSMNKKELILKFMDKEDFMDSDEYNLNILSSFIKEVEDTENKVKEMIFKKEKEHPHTIRYFAMPNPGCCDFDIYVIAKISNNGSTYVFAPNEKYLEEMSDSYSSIERI